LPEKSRAGEFLGGEKRGNSEKGERSCCWGETFYRAGKSLLKDRRKVNIIIKGGISRLKNKIYRMYIWEREERGVCRREGVYTPRGPESITFTLKRTHKKAFSIRRVRKKEKRSPSKGAGRTGLEERRWR